MAKNRFRTGPSSGEYEGTPPEDALKELPAKIEPWLAAVLQSEHLSLLLGSGFTIGVGAADRVPALGMGTVTFGCEPEARVLSEATRTARAIGRDAPNIEDQLRVALELLSGLTVIGDASAAAWRTSIDRVLKTFGAAVLATETAIRDALAKDGSRGRAALEGFLLAFASRPASRERLAIFTTNYDRLIECGCDRLGLRVIDRFVGTLAPEFRSSRQNVDLHYNPPGVRGEPRFLEGVVRLTKLHGSIDWSLEDRGLVRRPLPFGAAANHSEFPSDALRRCMIYPNAAKDSETLFYPYAELFRDFAAAVCQPNSTLVTYGYGFGDDHVNRVIRDMLSIPSTHLVTISYDEAQGRVGRFLDGARTQQTSVLVGDHFGDLPTLVERYLPKPAVDIIEVRKAALLTQRGRGPAAGAAAPGGAGG